LALPHHVEESHLPRRKAHAVYLSADELACVRTAALKRGYSKKRGLGRFMRDVVRLAAGYGSYDGPLFAPENPAGARNLFPLALAHDDLRKLYEASRFLRQAFESREIQAQPDQETLRMVLKRMQALTGYSQLVMLKHAPDAIDLASKTAHNAKAIAQWNPIFGNELLQGALQIFELLDPVSFAVHRRKKEKANGGS
jgi:hypothetical protein